MITEHRQATATARSPSCPSKRTVSPETRSHSLTETRKGSLAAKMCIDVAGVLFQSHRCHMGVALVSGGGQVARMTLAWVA